MLDNKMRKILDPAMEKIAAKLSVLGLTPNKITLIGFGLGLLSALIIATGNFLLALPILLLSRLADGLDGTLARYQGTSSDFGGFLDITLDFAFYGAIPLGFIIAEPSANAIAGAVLIVSFYVNGGSFLAYATMAEKQGLKGSPSKSLLYSTGLAEGTETIVVFVAFCLFPNWFSVLAYIFAAVVFYTAFSRIMLAKNDF